jgi:dephospho-CoA kinase
MQRSFQQHAAKLPAICGEASSSTAGRQFVLGVAGKYCSGKNALTQILLEHGFKTLDVDRIGHEVLEQESPKQQVLETFGDGLAGPDGRIDRKKLGVIVFADQQALRKLETIVHPLMRQIVERRLQAEPGLWVINAAVLFRMELHRLCDLVFCVRAPFLRRLKWARDRDHRSYGQTVKRLLAQRGICPKLNANEVDIYYVENKRSLNRLRAQALDRLRKRGILG